MTNKDQFFVSDKDRERIRSLAEKYAKIANLPEQAEMAEMWRKHNDLDFQRPMVLIFPEGAWREMPLDEDYQCESPFARGFETRFLLGLYYWEHMRDDNPLEPILYSPIHYSDTGIGIGAHSVAPDQATGASQFVPVINSEADLDKIQTPELSVDWDTTQKRLNATVGLFGDILEVKQQGRPGFHTAPLDAYSAMRGFDNMFMDLIDNPEMVHAFIGRLVDCDISRLKQAEELGVLSVGNRNHYSGSGGTCYTSELPADDFDGMNVRTKDLWGFAAAQIFSEVSPEMHNEFALRHEMKVLELAGLNAYGCCEPLHLKLDFVKKIPRLRRVSISPWADIKLSAEGLGSNYVYSWKPNPAIVAAETWDPVAVRAEIRDFLEVTRGCVVEMIMKDTHTCRNEPERMWEWTSIAREEAEAFV